MKIVVKKSLLLYCFKAYNYYEYDRRVCILARYLQKQFDYRLWKYLINTLYGSVIK